MGISPSQALTIEAHAKVNLCLSIAYPPQDGYHQVRSVFQELDLHDVMRVEVVPASEHGGLCTALGTPVSLDCPVGGLDPADNLVFRALDAAEQACGVPVVGEGHALAIAVEKHIPAGGGMGGGSSDAAAMLKACARITGVEALDPRIVEVARTLGADVAFFLHGGAALMGGRGDVLEQALPQLQAPIVLMGDDGGLSTAQVYRAFDADPQPQPDADALARAMQDDPADVDRIAALCANNLGPAACAASPVIRRRIELARRQPGVLAALVSGSGSTSFAICASEDAATHLAQAVSPECGWVRVCRVPPICA